MKFKESVVKSLQEKVKDYQSNERPIDKIDNMDYNLVSLDTIAKLPNSLKAPLHNQMS